MSFQRKDGIIGCVESQVRVWIATSDGRTPTLARELRERGFAIEGGQGEFLARTEAEVARWCDVVLLATSSESLDPEAALLVGLALGARRPLVFFGPVPIRAPSLAAQAHTLIEPLSTDAIAFQIRALGAKTADRRARREELGAKKLATRSPRYVADATDPTMVKAAQARQIESSEFESTVLRALAADTGVTSLGGDSWAARHVTGGRSSIVDALAWVDGAAPFNPIPVEFKVRASPAAIDQVFSILAASGATIGALVIGESSGLNDPQVDERDGRYLITISADSISRESSLFSRWIRTVRNDLAHGRRVRGEI